MPRVSLAVLAGSAALASCAPAPGAADARPGARGDAVVWAFAAPWDPRAAEHARRHAPALDGAISGWIGFDTVTGPVPQFADPLAADFAPPRLALVTTFLGDRFRPEIVRALAARPDLLALAARDVARHAVEGGYRGLVLDFEGHAAGDRPALLAAVRAIRHAAHAAGVHPVVVAVPPADTAAYPTAELLDAADLLMVMLYDQHDATTRPGPVSDPAWAARMLDLRLAAAPPERLVAALGAYGYRWRADSTAETIGWADARHLARTARLALGRDAASGSPRARRPGAAGWELWANDAALLARVAAAARARGVRRLAVWRLGLEDEAVWARLR